MNRITLALGMALLAGCAMPTITPEQRAYLLRMQEINAQKQASDDANYRQQLVNIQRNAQPIQAPAMQVNQGSAAFWTGKSQIAQSVTGMSGFNCEYNYAGRNFWRMFSGSCPSSVQVQ